MISRTALRRIELAPLDAREDLPKIRVAGHGLPEVDLGAARRDREHLGREVLPPPLLEPPVALERCAMLLERRPELGHVLARERFGEEDPRPLLGLREGDDRAHLVEHRLRGGVIHLVDRDHVGDLHDPSLQRLHRVTGAGHEHEKDGVRDPRHLHLALPCADGLDEDDVLARGVEQQHRLQGRLREPAEVAARPHRADVHARVEEVIGEADAVSEERAARERARGVDGDDADGACRPRGRARRARRRGSTFRLPAGP